MIWSLLWNSQQKLDRDKISQNYFLFDFVARIAQLHFQ